MDNPFRTMIGDLVHAAQFFTSSCRRDWHITSQKILDRIQKLPHKQGKPRRGELSEWLKKSRRARPVYSYLGRGVCSP